MKMLTNYIKTAYRNLSRNKIYALINILGLTIGVTLFIIISLFIHKQLMYDKFNENYENIYRLNKDDWGILGTAYGPEAATNFPEIKEFVRFNLHTFSNPLVTIGKNNSKKRIENFVFADSSVFDVFTFIFIKGDPSSALKYPFSVVLTEKIASQLFGNEEPMGKTIVLENKHVFKVSGVVENIPNFHLDISAIAGFSSLGKIYSDKDYLNSYGSWNFPTYFLLRENVAIPTLNDKLSKHFTSIFKEKFNQDTKMNFHLLPLSDIYFDTNTKYEIAINHGNLKFIYMFIAIALFIVIIAAINFINLTTAKAAGRAKEVGLRKVIGSNKKQLILQFLGESMLVSFMAFLLGLVLVETLLPLFNDLFQDTISNHYYREPFFWIIYFSGIILLGLVSGLYPAFYLTRFNPVAVMKGEQTRGKKGAGFRKLLTVFQFFISVILIIGTLTIYQQIKFMKNKDLGFNKDHQVYFTLTPDMVNKKEALKNEILKTPGVKSITYTSQPAGRITWQESWKLNGEAKQFTYQPIDPDYVKVMGLKIIRGENFSWEKPSFKERRGVLINEEAVNYFGVNDPVGKTINTNSSYWEEVMVVGIVKDFHYNSLHDKIAPLVMAWDERGRTANLLLSGNDISSTIEHLTSTWIKFAPEYPFEFHFLDQSFDRQYHDDERFGRLFTYFAIFAILIACLGLYGLSLYAVHYRKKEIGIRKANGASMGSIARMFLKEFGITILLANVIAWPVAFYFMERWLQSFPYRVKVAPWIFLVALVVSVLTAISTVSANTLKAAGTNPAIILKNE